MEMGALQSCRLIAVKDFRRNHCAIEAVKACWDMVQKDVANCINLSGKTACAVLGGGQGSARYMHRTARHHRGPTKAILGYRSQLTDGFINPTRTWSHVECHEVGTSMTKMISSSFALWCNGVVNGEVHMATNSPPCIIIWGSFPSQGENSCA